MHRTDIHLSVQVVEEEHRVEEAADTVLDYTCPQRLQNLGQPKHKLIINRLIIKSKKISHLLYIGVIEVDPNL
jgi:hypothetical protein